MKCTMIVIDVATAVLNAGKMWALLVRVLIRVRGLSEVGQPRRPSPSRTHDQSPVERT